MSTFSFFVGIFENQRLLQLLGGPKDRVMSSIYFKMNKETVTSEERVACSHFYNAYFYRNMAAFSAYTKCINFFLLLRVLLKPKASGVTLGFRGQGYELNLLHDSGSQRAIN